MPFGFKENFNMAYQAKTIKELLFTVCHHSHWYVGVVSFETLSFHFAEGMGNDDLPNDFFEVVWYMVETFLEVNMTHWKRQLTRVICPTQHDGHSCGVIALTFMEKRCADAFVEAWSQAKGVEFRLSWLGRVISHQIESSRVYQEGTQGRKDAQNLTPTMSMVPQHHGPVATSTPQHSLTVAKTKANIFKPSPSFNLLRPVSSISQGQPIPASVRTVNILSSIVDAYTYSEAELEQYRGVGIDSNHRNSAYEFKPGRPRLKTLGYDMSGVPPNKRKCPLCGPPFDETLVFSKGLEKMEICSFQCGKRWFCEAVAKPLGFAIIHGRCKAEKERG
jgi:hypothetical protein